MLFNHFYPKFYQKETKSMDKPVKTYNVSRNNLYKPETDKIPQPSVQTHESEKDRLDKIKIDAKKEPAPSQIETKAQSSHMGERSEQKQLAIEKIIASTEQYSTKEKPGTINHDKKEMPEPKIDGNYENRS